MAYKRKINNYRILIAVVAILLAMHFIGPLRSIEDFLRSLFLPATASIYKFSVKTGDNWRFFKNRQEFFDDYNSCYNKLGQSEFLSSQAKILENENIELRKQLDFAVKTARRLMPADVVGKNIDNIEKTIIINRGDQDGIKIGQAVIAGDGILVGKITKVNFGTSLVRLLNDGQSKVAATILNKDHSLGVLEGGYGLSYRRNFIPRNEVVLVGDMVISSGMEAGMPRNLFLGTVAVVENEAYKPFQQAVISPVIDVTKVTVVSVIVD